MAEPALKIVEPAAMSLRRVGMPDLQDKGAWLCRRIKERWPHMQDRQILTWLNSASGANECFFVRYERAFGLFYRIQDVTDPFPRVVEKFVLAETDDHKHPKDSEAEKVAAMNNQVAVDQAANLYLDARRWAEGISAMEIEVCNYSDVPSGRKGSPEAEFPHTVKKRIGRLFAEEILFVKVGDTEK